MMLTDKEDMKKKFFKNFHEYWHYIRHLNDNQKQLIFDNLPEEERISIEKSLERGGWKDLIMRDLLNELIDSIYKKHKYNVIEIKCKALNNKSVYMPRKVWEEIVYEASKYKEEYANYLIGGIEGIVCEKNPNVVLVAKKGSQE